MHSKCLLIHYRGLSHYVLIRSNRQCTLTDYRSTPMDSGYRKQVDHVQPVDNINRWDICLGNLHVSASRARHQYGSNTDHLQ